MINEEQVVLNIFKRLLTDEFVYVNETFGSSELSSLYVDGNVSYNSIEEQKIFISWLDKVREEAESK